jgi:hypothetical protein
VLRRLSVVVGLAACAWALGAGSAHAQTGTYWCAGHPSLKTCVVSATYDGSPFTASDPSFDVWAIPAAVSGAKTVQWTVQPVSPANDLSAELGHTFSVTIKTNVNPREMDGFGAAMTYDRSGPTGGEYQVTLTAQPVSVTDQDGCTFPAGGPTCTPIAPGPSKVILQGEISDYNYTAYTTNPALPAGFVDSFSGMDMYTNVAETSLPPSIVEVSGQNELRIDLTDHHFLQDGTTVVHGDFYLRIPAAFLSTYWGIDDLSTLATDGLHASVGAGGGTLTVTVEPGNTGVQVQINGLTFSRRKLIVKVGHVTPHAPTHIKAKRLSSSKARVTFRAARPRGQKVTGYRLLCAVSSSDVVLVSTVKARRSPITLRRLAPRKPYRCTLQARSKAGYGARSRQFSVPR